MCLFYILAAFLYCLPAIVFQEIFNLKCQSKNKRRQTKDKNIVYDPWWSFSGAHRRSSLTWLSALLLCNKGMFFCIYCNVYHCIGEQPGPFCLCHWNLSQKEKPHQLTFTFNKGWLVLVDLEVPSAKGRFFRTAGDGVTIWGTKG